jgi:hypothetical protein
MIPIQLCTQKPFTFVCGVWNFNNKQNNTYTYCII